MRIFFMLVLAMVSVSLTACGEGQDDVEIGESEASLAPPEGTRFLKVGEVEVDGVIVDQLVYDDGSEEAQSLFPDSGDDELGVLQQGLYAGNCWASRAGSQWRVSNGDRDYHALFNVSANERYYVYMSAALWAALQVAGKPLVHFRDGNRVAVNLGSNGRWFYYSVWVRRTSC